MGPLNFLDESSFLYAQCERSLTSDSWNFLLSDSLTRQRKIPGPVSSEVGKKTSKEGALRWDSRSEVNWAKVARLSDEMRMIHMVKMAKMQINQPLLETSDGADSTCNESTRIHNHKSCDFGTFGSTLRLRVSKRATCSTRTKTSSLSKWYLKYSHACALSDWFVGFTLSRDSWRPMQRTATWG